MLLLLLRKEEKYLAVESRPKLKCAKKESSSVNILPFISIETSEIYQNENVVRGTRFVPGISTTFSEVITLPRKICEQGKQMLVIGWK